MIVSAIRVSDVGPFRSPVAIEGLSAGLNVLAGANELGKSTLFHALSAVLTERFSTASTKGHLHRIRPRRGGSPLVEAELEFAGTRWRIRKRFGAGRMALLTGPGVALRNGDAEERLVELIGAGSGLAGLMWVAQGRSDEPPALAEADASAIFEFLAGEVEQASEGERLGDVLAALEARLGEVMTLKSWQPRAGGRLAALIAEAARLETDLAGAIDRQSRAEQALDALETARRTLGELNDPARAAARRQEDEQLRMREAEGLRLRAELALADERKDHASAAAAHAAERLSRLDRAIADLARVEAEIGRRLETMKRLIEAAVPATAAAAADQEAAILARALADARERRDTLMRFERRAGLERTHRELATKLAEARAAEAAAGEFEVALAANAADEAAMAGIETLERERLRLTARLEATAPVIDIALLPAARSRVRIDGRLAGNREQLRPLAPLEIEVDGIGRFTITPGGTEAQADAAKLTAAQSALAAALAVLKVGDVEAARRLAATRRSLVQERTAALRRRDDRAPAGIDRLAEAAAQVAAELAASPPLVRPDGAADELDAAVRLAATAAEAAAEKARHVARQADDAAARIARLEAEQAADERRRDELTRGLAPPEVRAGERARLAAATEAAERKAQDGRRAHALLAEQAVAAGPLEAIRRRLADLGTAEQQRQQRARELEIECARLETELSIAADADVKGTVDRLASAVASVRAEIGRITRDAEAWRLLREVLAAEREAARARVLEPAAERMMPYLTRLFPAAALKLASTLRPTGLSRAGLDEEIGDLSRGTQEQLAVIARLGLARVLADSGRPLPLVLDDALTFSDETRLEAMFSALAAAAAHHQVILLTCREMAATSLARQYGATLLTLSPWQIEGGS